MYFNKHDYADVPYPHVTDPKGTIKSAGDCPVVIAMALTELGIKTDPIEIAQLALENHTRLPYGTDIDALCSHVAKKFSEDIVVTKTNDIGLLKAALLRGSKVICCIGGKTGAFSKSPTLVVAVEIDGDTVFIWDPGYPQYKRSVNIYFELYWSHPDIYMDINCLHAETEGYSPRYYVFDGPSSIDNLPL